MMKIKCTILFLLAAQMLCAQPYSITGAVTNRQHQGLPLSTVVLRNIPDKEELMNVVSDTSGHYRFTNLSAGQYIVTASHTGFVTRVSDTITIGTSGGGYRYDFVLEEAGITLQEVTIKNKKQSIEIDKGKIVFNVKNDATASGLTAFDILKKLPGVSIDQDEKITLRGSSGVNILVDGKMTYLSGRQLTAFLKGLSAEDINKIELNLTPSAEYDAAGNAGIINIVPNKNLKQGYAVDIRSGITKGRYWMADENISASHRSKKVSLYGSLGFKMPRSQWKSRSGNTINDGAQPKALQRQNESVDKPLYYSWHTGAEWQLLPKHRLGVDYNGYFDDWKAANNSVVTGTDGNDIPIPSIRSSNIFIEPYHYDAVNLSYRFDIDTTGKKITAETHYVSYRNYSDGTLTTDEYDAAGHFVKRNVLRSHQPGFIRIRSAKADAELPFKTFSIKTGLKYAEVTNDNQYRFDSLLGGNYVEVDNMSNHFKYKERIAAAYISVAEKINKTSIDAGLRLEYTKADGYTVKQDVSNHWAYTKLFPSFSIEQEINDDDKINFSASRRINRPSYSELNPVRWYTDQYFYYAGNPDLVPEMAWIFSTAYTLQRKYVFTVTYNFSNNYINRKLTHDGSAIKTQAFNLGNMQRIDLIASLPVQVLPVWELQLMPDVSYMSYPLSQFTGETILSKWFATLSVQQQLKLPAGIKMDISTECSSAALRGIYVTHSYFYTDLGFKRSFFTNKLDVQLTLSDLFNSNRYRGVSQSNITDYYYNDKPDTRRIGIALHYHLGSDLIKGNNKKTEEQERL